jgi:hypothetical protein
MRVLKPGGKLILELPDLKKVLEYFTYQPLPMGKTMWALYGDPTHQNEHMCHRWAYTPATIGSLLHIVGFERIQSKEPQFHVKGRDMRIECYKPEAR